MGTVTFFLSSFSFFCESHESSLLTLQSGMNRYPGPAVPTCSSSLDWTGHKFPKSSSSLLRLPSRRPPHPYPTHSSSKHCDFHFSPFREPLTRASITFTACFLGWWDEKPDPGSKHGPTALQSLCKPPCSLSPVCRVGTFQPPRESTMVVSLLFSGISVNGLLVQSNNY